MNDNIITTPPIEVAKNNDVLDFKDLRPDELKHVQELRERQERKEACFKELNVLLQKYGAVLAVNPHSPVGKPEAYILIQ